MSFMSPHLSFKLFNQYIFPGSLLFPMTNLPTDIIVPEKHNSSSSHQQQSTKSPVSFLSLSLSACSSMGILTTNLMSTLTLLLISSSLNQGALSAATEYKPASLASEYRQVIAGADRRVLAPFQLCLDCRCCAANDPNDCATMPCCFGIDCNLPEKPFGVCAFLPRTCNCTFCQ